ncbi:MAG: zinc metallopeptidase [Spirochaetales bacterium]|jgi:Zn-dependent membrane protease YugP|nr:zinc metallopeptidase [Spirochaetales bacterium]
MYFDPLYLLISAPVLIFSMLAQWAVKSNFSKYSKVRNSYGISGSEIARLILERNGIMDVKVEPTRGWLSDHYSPSERVLRLSEPVYNSNSIAAIGVAAHEAGHALQHKFGYSMMTLRQCLAYPASFASNISVWLIVIGALIGAMGLAKIGFVLFCVVVLFQIVTLPVEFDASRRAKKLLIEYGIADSRDSSGVASVLNAAAMTYVAAAASSISQLLYYAIRLGLLNRRDD